MKITVRATSEIIDQFYKMSVEELTKEQVQMLRKAFDMFDREKRGCIHTNMVSTILRTLGQSFEEKELQALIKEIDADGK